MNDFDFIHQKTNRQFQILCEIAGHEVVKEIVLAVINGNTSDVEKIIKTGITGQNVVPFIILYTKVFYEGLLLIRENRLEVENFILTLCKKFKLKKKDPSIYVMLMNFHKECLKFVETK